MKPNEGKNIEGIIEEKENSNNGTRWTRSSKIVFNERDRIPETSNTAVSDTNKIDKTNSTSPQTYATTPKKKKNSLLSLHSSLSPNDENNIRGTRLRNQQQQSSPIIVAENTDETINELSTENSNEHRITRRTTKTLSKNDNSTTMEQDYKNKDIQNSNNNNEDYALSSNYFAQDQCIFEGEECNGQKDLSVDSSNDVDNLDVSVGAVSSRSNFKIARRNGRINKVYKNILENDADVKSENLHVHILESNEDSKINLDISKNHSDIVVQNTNLYESDNTSFNTDEVQTHTENTLNKHNFSNINDMSMANQLSEKEESAIREEKDETVVPLDSIGHELNVVSDCNQNIVLDAGVMQDAETLLPADNNLVGILDGDVVFDLISSKEERSLSGENLKKIISDEYTLPATTLYNDFNSVITHPTSPSNASLDSAKGASVTNDPSTWGSLTTGDLFWAQIYNYCYWPCMVCPDPEGNIVSTTNMGRSNDKNQSVVHVRFFADNGRRNWAKQDNLIAYNGLEHFSQLADAVKEKYGARSAKYKLYIPKKTKLQLWHVAINEANTIAETHYPERLEKFYDIFEKSKNFLKLERKRRQSMFVSTSDVGSMYDSSDNIYGKHSHTLDGGKRERSVSPFSPAYSPVKSSKVKRRKLSDSTRHIDNFNQIGLISANMSRDVLELFQNHEFQQLYGTMREYVMGINQDELIERSLVTAVRNIWALKEINEQKMEKEVVQTNTISHDLGSSIIKSINGNGEDTVKRLSNRLKSINSRHSVATFMSAEKYETLNTTSSALMVSSSGPTSTEKSKKPLNRPIEEVIDDIYNLDSKYLFRGLSRDPVCKYCCNPDGNLVRCSKKCMSWLHLECLYKPKTEVNNHRFVRRSKSNNTDDGAIGKPEEELIEKQQSGSIHNVNVDLIDVNSMMAIEHDDTTKTENVVCNECSNNMPNICCICQQCDLTAESLVFCQMGQCAKAFHPTCCKYWPQARVANATVRCPSHVCHTCVSDDPKGKFQNLSNSKLTKCVKCPASYHMDSTCIPAGSEILTASSIICPRHYISKADANVNVNWCFVCVKGGQVLCCETCPISVHAQCLNIQLDTNDLYICEECESGRMPLYGEMVWAKFNSFRWWPAIILPPTEVPVNIMRKAHHELEFVVRFFGTHDHGWISRRRVYLYLEGDSSQPPRTKSSLDQSYLRGIQEAKKIYDIIKMKKTAQNIKTEIKEKLHPQPYIKIKTNRPVPPVKLHIDMESVSKCECKANDQNPCGPDSNCLNRVLYHECNPKICSAKERCQNQMFEKRKSPRLDVVYTKERGFGLICREPISVGTFVIEYVGEIINDDEFKQRISQKALERDENFYFLSVEKDYIIDAGPKGNLARFMNHSCDPNCETQKWVINSINRVGLFAIKDIPEDTELTFNYHWDELLGTEKKKCFCGADKCAGQIGGKYKEEIKENKDTQIKKKDKKKKPLKRLQKPPAIKIQSKLSAKLISSVTDIKIHTTTNKRLRSASQVTKNKAVMLNVKK